MLTNPKKGMPNRPNKPFLSILITTYNRSFALAKCLESIEQVLSSYRRVADIEVIVFNNGCTDDTAAVTGRFEQTLPLRVFHEEHNIGFINGLLKLIGEAQGRYTWFLGDDDYIVISDLDMLIRYMEKAEPDILLLNHYCYISEKDKTKFLMKDGGPFLMRKTKGCYASYSDYILDARHPNSFFCHIAPIIFRRDQWHLHFSKEVLDRYARSYSGHFFVFLSMLRSAGKVCYYNEQTLALCFGAPSDAMLTEEGRYYRFMMAAEYFPEMFKDVFCEKRLLEHFNNVMLKNDIFVLLLGSKIKCDFPFSFYLRLFKLLYRHYKTHLFFWYGVLPLFATPRSVFLLLYNLFLKRS